MIEIGICDDDPAFIKYIEQLFTALRQELTFYLYHGRIPPLLSEAKVGDECRIYFTGTIDFQ